MQAPHHSVRTAVRLPKEKRHWSLLGVRYAVPYRQSCRRVYRLGSRAGLIIEFLEDCCQRTRRLALDPHPIQGAISRGCPFPGHVSAGGKNH